jgi:Domain of unknown function (DUF4440)
MPRILALLATSDGCNARPTAGTLRSSSQEQLEDEWAKALETHDTTFLARVVAPDFHGTADSAKTFGRADVLSDAADTTTQLRNVRDQDREVRIYDNGTVAVVTALGSWTVEKGKLWLNGKDLRGLPLTRRKRAIERVIPATSTVLSRVFAVEGRGRDLFAASEKLDLEGIVAKRKADPYAPSTVWYKVDPFDTFRDCCRPLGSEYLKDLGSPDHKGPPTQIGATPRGPRRGHGLGLGSPSRVPKSSRADRVGVASRQSSNSCGSVTAYVTPRQTRLNQKAPPTHKSRRGFNVVDGPG